MIYIDFRNKSIIGYDILDKNMNNTVNGEGKSPSFGISLAINIID